MARAHPRRQLRVHPAVRSISDRRRLGGLVLTAALGATAGSALAATSVNVTDGNDTRAAVDFSAVKSAHNRVQDRLVHTFSTFDAITPTDLANTRSPSGPPGSICISMWTTRVAGESDPNYDLCITAKAAGRGFDASLIRNGGRGSVRRVVGVKVEQPSSKRLVVRIDPDRIRRPRSYRWTAQSATYGSGCHARLGCRDFVPNGRRTAETELGRPRGFVDPNTR